MVTATPLSESHISFSAPPTTLFTSPPVIPQKSPTFSRQRPRDDVLVQRAAPLEEAPWANASCLWSDIEQAMKALPFHHAAILWMTVCEGEGSWRNGIKRYNWREKVGDFWGITGGDVNKVVGGALKEMCASLNGVAVSDSSLVN